MIVDLSQHAFSSGDKLFFDANVWLAIFPPPSNSQGERQRKYSKLLKRCKKASADVYIDSTVLSEYLNAYIRVRIAQSYPEYVSKFKEFREKCNSDYRVIAGMAESNMREILRIPNIHVIDCKISGFDCDVMLTDFGAGHSDWNDLVIVEVCKGGSFDLITHDGDFKDVQGLNIMTYNENLLKVS